MFCFVHRPPGTALWRLAPALLIVLSGAGCGALPDESECTANADCDAGFECREGKCVVAGAIACTEKADCENALEKGSWKPTGQNACQQPACVKKSCKLEPRTDGSFCEDNDGADYLCTNGACQAGSCVPGQNVIKDSCFIGDKNKPKPDVCAVAGTPNKNNPCEICDPGEDAWAWSPAGADTSCTGAFNADEKCSEGRCDGKGACASNAVIKDGFCCIGCSASAEGACEDKDQVNDANDCQVCNPIGSKTAWTSALTGKACKDDDGLSCTSGACDNQGACSKQKVEAGKCAVDVDGTKKCKSDDDKDAGGCNVCKSATSQVAWTPSPSGDACDGDGVTCTLDECDGKGACEANKAIAGGTCYIAGDAGKACHKPNDSKLGSGGCLACNPDASQDEWTELPDQATCSIDGQPCLAANCNKVGVCEQKKVKAGFCHIGLAEAATCYTDGDVDPANDCQRCDASDPVKIPIDAWTPKSSSDACKADDIQCTTDVCDGKGKCEHTATDDLCNNAKGPCQKNVCNVLKKLCVPENLAETEPCPGPDAVTCTVELCDGQGQCSDTGKPNDKLCDDEIACSLDVCEPGKGCTHKPEAKKHCDDGNVCTDDLCDLSKGCLHPHNKSPCKTDDLACTLEACVDGKCDKKIDANHCVIDSKTCAKKDDTSAKGCMVCNPTADQNKWTATAAASKCDGDGIPCTADACDGKGACASKLAAGKCLIDKKCYGDGDLKAGSGKCQRCETKAKTTAWSPVAKGAPCEADGVGCTVDTCSGSGTCQHAADNLKCTDPYGCTTNLCDAKLDCQYVDNCAWGHFCNKDAKACTTKAPVILIKQSNNDKAPTNPAAVRHVVDAKTGKSRLWVVYQSQACATASNGTWSIDKGAALRAIALDSHSHVDKTGKDVPLAKGGTQKPPVSVNLPAALKGKEVCQGFPVVSADPESSSQAWVSWLEAGVGAAPECLKNGGQGGVLRLGLLDGSAVAGGVSWGKVAGATCTAGKFSGPLFLTGGFRLLGGSNGAANVTKRGVVSVRSQGGDLATWGAQKLVTTGPMASATTTKVSTSASEFGMVHAALVDMGKQAKEADARYVALAIALESKKFSLWSAALDGKGAKGPTSNWLNPAATPAAGGLKGISAICGLDATYNNNTGEVGVVLVARDGSGGLDDRVYLVTKKGAGKAKVVAIEDKGTVGTGGACHYGLMAGRIVATSGGFAIVYYGADNPGDPGKPTVASITFAAGKATVSKQNIAGMSVWPTDSSAQAKSVPALAWRGLGDLVANADGTLTIVAEVKKVAERGLAIYTFKP